MQNDATQATESRPSKPMGVPSALVNSLGFLLGKAAQRVRERFEDALKPLGIVSRHYGVLATLAESGPLPQQAVGDRLQIDRTTMVTSVDLLEHLGVVTRQRDPKDRRVYLLSLTPNATSILNGCHQIVAATEALFLKPLTNAERAHLRDMLNRLLYTSENGSEHVGANDLASSVGANVADRLDRVSLQVRDLARSRHFYCDVLEFVESDEHGPGSLCFHADAGTTLELARLEGTGRGTEALGRGVRLWFGTRNLEALLERVRRHDCQVLRGPEDSAVGRAFTVADPDGYEVTLHALAM